MSLWAREFFLGDTVMRYSVRTQMWDILARTVGTLLHEVSCWISDKRFEAQGRDIDAAKAAGGMKWE